MYQASASGRGGVGKSATSITHYQHRLKREPKSSPLGGPGFEGLIGGYAVSELVARIGSSGPRLFAVVGGRTADLAEQVRATALHRFLRSGSLRTESQTGRSRTTPPARTHLGLFPVPWHVNPAAASFRQADQPSGNSTSVADGANRVYVTFRECDGTRNTTDGHKRRQTSPLEG